MNVNLIKVAFHTGTGPRIKDISVCTDHVPRTIRLVQWGPHPEFPRHEICAGFKEFKSNPVCKRVRILWERHHLVHHALEVAPFYSGQCKERVQQVQALVQHIIASLRPGTQIDKDEAASTIRAMVANLEPKPEGTREILLEKTGSIGWSRRKSQVIAAHWLWKANFHNRLVRFDDWRDASYVKRLLD